MDTLRKVLTHQKVAITQLAIRIDSQVTHPVVAMEKGDEEHVLTKCCRINSFQVTIDLLNSENLKVAIAQLSNELQVCNFTML